MPAPAPAPAPAAAAPAYSPFVPGTIPANWKRIDRSKFEGNGCAVDVTSTMKDAIADLMNKTAVPSLHGSGSNPATAKGLGFDTFVVTKVERIQNLHAFTQHNLKRELGEPHSSTLLDHVKAVGPGRRTGRDMPSPTALKFQPEASAVSLDANRNEHLLFHGTRSVCVS